MLRLKNCSANCGEEFVILGGNEGILHAYCNNKREFVILFTNKARERSWYNASTKMCKKAWYEAIKVTKIRIPYEEFKEKFLSISDQYDFKRVIKEKGYTWSRVNGVSYLYDKRKYVFVSLTNEILPTSDVTIVGDTAVPTNRLDDFTFVCEECGNRHLNGNKREVCTSETETVTWCVYCVLEKAFRCNHCGLYHVNSMRSDDAPSLCTSCRPKYDHCEHCGGLYLRSEMNTVEGKLMCRDCMRQVYTSRVRSYHDNPEMIYNVMSSEDPDTKLFIGTEIETEGQTNTQGEYIRRIVCTKKHGKDERCIYQMHDGSLNSMGIECITQPMTKAFWDNFDFEDWFEELVEEGAMATRNTGLHVHLSREWMGVPRGEEQDLFVGRLRQFLSDNQALVEKFARRKECNWSRFKKSFDKNNKPEEKDERTNRHKYNAKDGDRYTSVNNTNYATIEFRIFAGTLSETTYRASVEFCLRLIDYIKTHDENTETWEEFITYKELPASMKTYMKSLGMNTEF